MLPKKSPINEFELLKACQKIEGLTFSQLAEFCDITIPLTPSKRKGWAGQAIEMALGTTAGNKALPDFHLLNIELKTIPLAANGKPAESTYITSIPLLTIQQQQWQTSTCFKKLQKILWVPVEGDKQINFNQRRIGKAILWSPNKDQQKVLAADWEELVTMISTGHLEEINATMGMALQIRPKASNAKSLCFGFDSKGNKILTLPRGFYLRAEFTNIILTNCCY